VNMRHFINSLVIILIAAVAGFAAALLLVGCHHPQIAHPTPVVQPPVPVVPVTPAVTAPAQPESIPDPTEPPPRPNPQPEPSPQPLPTPHPEDPPAQPQPEPKPTPTPLPPPPVCLCHNAKITLCRPPVGNLPPGAWNAHLSHGDPVGACR